MQFLAGPVAVAWIFTQLRQMLAYRLSELFSKREHLVERGGAFQPASPKVHSKYRGIDLGTDYEHTPDQKQCYVSRRQR